MAKVVFESEPVFRTETDETGRLWVSGYASTSKPDETHDIVLPKAFQNAHLSKFAQNPVLLFMHNMAAPIGRVTELRVDKKGLWIRGYVAPPTTEALKQIHTLIQHGVLNAFSIGFIPLEEERMTVEEAEERGLLHEEDKALLNLEIFDEVNVISKLNLIEISLVSVGMNREALLENKDVAHALKLLEKIKQQETFVPDIHQVEVEEFEQGMVIKFIGSDLEPKQNRSKEKPMKTRKKGVVPFRRFPLADPDTPWSFTAADGNRILDRGGWRLYKAVHTWFEGTGTPERRNAYKLPHHKIIGGQVKTVWRGVRAAMAALLGARGGVQIPQADRRGVYRHLARHYREFEKEPPEFRSINEENYKEVLAKNPELAEFWPLFVSESKVDMEFINEILQAEAKTEETAKTKEVATVEVNYEDFLEKIKAMLEYFEEDLVTKIADILNEVLKTKETEPEEEKTVEAGTNETKGMDEENEFTEQIKVLERLEQELLKVMSEEEAAKFLVDFVREALQEE